MADIKELGESLLARAKATNKAQYKKTRNEGYKIAALTAGVGLMNEAVKQNAIQFMGSEEVMANRAKYRAAVNRAGNIASLNEQIQTSGKTPEQYFYETRYLPQMQEEYKAQFGAQYVPESYLPNLRDKALELSRKDAEDFAQAYEMAASIPDMETAMNDFNTVVMPPTTVGAGALERIKGFFTGRKEGDFRDEAIQRINDQGLIKNESYKAAFDRVAQSQGLDEAVNFVRTLDTSGFTKNEIVDVKTEIMAADGGAKFFSFTTTQVIDPDSGKVLSAETTSKEHDGFKSPEAIKDLTLAAIDRIDIAGSARTTLTPKGLSEVNIELEKRGLNLDIINTMDDAKIVAEVYRQASQVQGNIRDDVNKQVVGEVMGRVLEASKWFTEGNATEMANSGKPLPEIISFLTSQINTGLNSSYNPINPDQSPDFSRVGGSREAATPSTTPVSNGRPMFNGRGPLRNANDLQVNRVLDWNEMDN